MARTNEAAVTLAIDTSLTTAQIEAFIDDASAWVDANLSGKGLSSTVLTAIEKYLACHLITLRDPRVRSSKYGDTNETFQRDTSVTEYLKAAIGLDPTGTVEGAFTDAGPTTLTFRVSDGYDDDLNKLGVVES